MEKIKHPQDVAIDKIIDRIMRKKHGADWHVSTCLGHNSKFDKTLKLFH